MPKYFTRKQNIWFAARICSLILLGLFVLGVILLYLNSAFGWFAQNKEVGGDAMAVTAYQDDVEAEYSHYFYDAKNAVGVGEDSITDIQVPQYDLIFRQRNRYTPAVIRVALTGEEDLPQSGTIALTIGRNLAASITTDEGTIANGSELPALNNLFSSLMRLTIVKGAGIYSDDPTTLYRNIDNLPYGNDSTLYEVIKSQTANNATTNVFTTVTGDEGDPDRYTKADSVTLSIDYTAADWNDIDGDGVNETLNVYVYVTYDETLLREYGAYDATLNGDITSVGQVIKLSNDLLTIAASHS